MSTPPDEIPRNCAQLPVKQARRARRRRLQSGGDVICQFRAARTARESNIKHNTSARDIRRRALFSSATWITLAPLAPPRASARRRPRAPGSIGRPSGLCSYPSGACDGRARSLQRIPARGAHAAREPCPPRRPGSRRRMGHASQSAREHPDRALDRRARRVLSRPGARSDCVRQRARSRHHLRHRALRRAPHSRSPAAAGAAAVLPGTAMSMRSSRS